MANDMDFHTYYGNANSERPTPYERDLIAFTATQPTYTVDQYRETLAALLLCYRKGVEDTAENLRQARNASIRGNSSWAGTALAQYTHWRHQLETIEGVMACLREYDEGGLTHAEAGLV